MKIIRSEPALFIGLVGAVVALVVTFGLKLSADQIGAIMTAVAALMAIVTRSQVSPASQVVALAVDGQTVAGPAHPAEDGTPVDVTVAA